MSKQSASERPTRGLHFGAAFVDRRQAYFALAALVRGLAYIALAASDLFVPGF